MNNAVNERAKTPDLELSDHNKEVLDLLISNPDDMVFFMEKFWRGVDYQFFSISEFRDYKIKQNAITLFDFRKMYGPNPKGALEALFLYPVKPMEIDLLDLKLKNGEMTLEKLYADHWKNPELPLARFVL